MSQYQSIPKTVEALQWTGENLKEMKAFIGEVQKFEVMQDDTIMVTEISGDVDFINKDYYVIKKNKTFATSTKENFERNFELKQQDLFFDNIPIVIFKGFSVANEGKVDFWSVQIPINYQDFMCGWYSTIQFIEVADAVNLAFLGISTFDSEQTEYTNLNDAKTVAEYVKVFFGEKYKSEIVIFA